MKIFRTPCASSHRPDEHLNAKTALTPAHINLAAIFKLLLKRLFQSVPSVTLTAISRTLRVLRIPSWSCSAPRPSAGCGVRVASGRSITAASRAR